MDERVPFLISFLFFFFFFFFAPFYLTNSNYVQSSPGWGQKKSSQLLGSKEKGESVALT
jgi:hypothetical protein